VYALNTIRSYLISQHIREHVFSAAIIKRFFNLFGKEICIQPFETSMELGLLSVEVLS